MFRNIKSFFTKTKSTLFTFNNEPFSKFSILFIIILDIFLLVTILTGIDSEKEMSPKIYVKYPSVCQNHFNVDSQNNSKSDGTFPFIEYNDFFIASNLAYNSRENIPIHEDRRAAPLCVELYEKIALFANTKAFKKNKRLLSNLQNSKRNILSDIDNIEKRYNTSLFEKLSSLNDNSYKTIKKKYYKLLEKEKNIDIQIKGIKKVSSYKGYQAYVKFVNDNTKMVKEELNTYKLWQPFISFLYLLKFTLPLLILSFLLYRFSTSVHRVASISTKLTALISSHIIIITLLPIAINIMYLIYHVIPQRFLKSVIDALYQFGFIFLGYYFLMLIGIITLGAIIFLIQRGVSQRENLRRKIKEKTLYIDAYNQKQCPHCKNRVDYSKNYCGYCSEGLHRECHSCKKKTPKQIEYCMECGEKELSI